MPTFILIIVLALSLSIPACATFKIPAPKDSVKPMSEPLSESSTITVPITISLEALSGKLNRIFSGNKTLNKLNQKDNITGKLQEILSGQATLSDSELLNDFYLRYTIRKAWEALQSPIRLNYNLSLLLNPQSVQISPPARRGDTARIVVGLIAKPKLVGGDVPQTSPMSLPVFAVAPGLLENGFHVVLDNELSFDFISSELTRKLTGKIYSIDSKNIIIERVKMYCSEDLVVMEVRVNGTAKGTMFLAGVPAYDESTQTLYVNNLDYTIKTKQVLVKAADWLLHTNLRESLIKQARWDITDKINSIKDQLSDAINRKVNRYVRISGKIQGIRLLAMGITKTSIKAVLVADGKVEINVF